MTKESASPPAGLNIGTPATRRAVPTASCVGTPEQRPISAMAAILAGVSMDLLLTVR